MGGGEIDAVERLLGSVYIRVGFACYLYRDMAVWHDKYSTVSRL